MTRPRVVLFDFGRTLADIDAAFFETRYAALLARHGFACEPDDLLAAARSFWGEIDGGAGYDHAQASVSAEAYDRWAMQAEAQVLQRLGLRDPSHQLLSEAMALIDAVDERYSLYDDTLPALDLLRDAGYRLGVISNFGWGLPRLIAALGLAPYFDAVVSSARAGYRKPHPAIFSHTLRLFDARPSEALVVGDSLHADVLGAQRAGIAGLLLDRNARQAGEAPSIASLAGLAPWLEAGASNV